MADLSPQQVVASFDSASVLHAGLAAALRGEPFPHLGHSAAAAAAVRVAGRLPWPLLRPIYTRVGAAEGLDPARLGDVDLAAVAGALADGYPQRRYPAVMVGCSNGAMTHLAAASGVPWLPGTVLVPVARTGDPHRPVDAMRFGARHAPALLDRNPDVGLHHMHDQNQDELMTARMTYFRTKWRGLPAAYERFLTERLGAGAPVVLIEDSSTWPVTRVGERHVFQAGAQGGLEPPAYQARPHTPAADDEAAEAEWGADPAFGAAVQAWCAAKGHPLVHVRYGGPQAPAAGVADTLRGWYRRRGEDADRLLVPSFVLADPWRTVSTATVPYWTFFSVQPALHAFDAYLSRAQPYRNVGVMLFEHGVDSAGIARPQEWLAAARRHGARAHLVGVDPRRFPHDIGALGRYGGDLAKLPGARRPWSPLPVQDAVAGLSAAGLLR